MPESEPELPPARSRAEARVPQHAIELGLAIELELVIVAAKLPTDAKTVQRNYLPIEPTGSATVIIVATPYGVISLGIFLATATVFGEIIRITLGGTSIAPTAGPPGEP